MDQDNQEENPFLKLIEENPEKYRIEKNPLKNQIKNQIVKDDTFKVQETEPEATEEENPFLKLIEENPEKYRIEKSFTPDKSQVLKNYDFKTQDFNTDQETEIVKLSNQFQVDPDFIRNDLQYFQKLNSKTTYDFDKLSQQYPKTTDFLTEDITNYSVSKNEIDKIKNIEKLEQEHGLLSKSYKSLVNVGLASAAKGIIDFSKLAFDQAGYGAEQLSESIGQEGKTFKFSELSKLTNDYDLKTEYAKKLIETKGYKPTWELAFVDVIDTASKYWEKKVEKERKYIPELQSEEEFDLLVESVINLKDFEGEKFTENASKAGKIVYYKTLTAAPNLLTAVASLYAGNPTYGLSLMMGGAAGQKYSENLKLQEQRQIAQDKANEEIERQIPISIESGQLPVEGEPKTPEELAAIKTQPLITTEQAMASAYISGAIEGVTEKYLGTFKIFSKYLKQTMTPVVKTLQKRIGYESTKAVIKEFSKNILLDAGQGFTEEASSSILNDFSDFILDLQSEPITVLQAAKRAFNSGLVGAFLEGGAASPNALMYAANQSQEFKQAQLDRDYMLAIGPEINNLELKQKLPEKQQKLVEKLTANGPVENIYIPVDKFDGYYQANNDDPSQAAAEIGISKEYDDAKQTGDLVKIPTEKWARIAGTQSFKDLANEAKTSPDSKSYNESLESQKNLEANLKEVIKQDTYNQKILKETQQIEQDIANKLISSGVYENKKEAYLNAKVYAENYRVRSNEVYAGKSPLEIYNQEGLKIVGLPDIPEGIQVFAQADQLSPEFEKNSQIVNSLNEDFTLEQARTAFKDLTTKEKKALGLDKYFKQLNKSTSTKAEFLNYLQSREALPQADKTKRIKGFFDPINKFVGLIKGEANLSTFLHEGGHVFLDQIKLDYAYLKSIDPEKLNIKQQAFIERAQTILDFLEVKSFSEIGRDQHEKWARSFEAYLMEGKAPSVKLKKAFKAFADWLTNIYKSLKGLETISGQKINLSPEVRGIFDALLTTQEELGKANKNYTNLIQDLEKSGMSKELVSKYNSAEDLVNAEASSFVTKVALDNFKKTQTEIYKKQEDTIRQRLLENLKTKKEQEHLLIIETDPSAENQTPKELAKTFNYKSVNEFNEAMAKARVDRDNVELEVQKEMEILYPNAMADVESLALFALHNENQRTKLDIEVNFLNDLIIKIPVEESKLRQAKEKFLTRQKSTLINKEEAINFLSTKNIKEGIKPYKFERAERKAASLAISYYKKYLESDNNDQKFIFLEKAFQEKIKQVQNHELFKAAYEMNQFYKKNVQSIKTKFNKSNKELVETRNLDYINLGRSIGAKFKILNSDKKANEYLQEIKKYDPKTYQDFVEIINSIAGNAGPVDQIPYRDFVSLVNSLNKLWSLSRSTELQTIEGKKIENNKILKDFVEVTKDLFKTEKNKKDFFRYQRDNDSFTVKGLTFLAKQKRMQQFFRYLDKGNPNGPFTKALWQRIDSAYFTKHAKQQEINSKIKEVITNWQKTQDKKTVDKEIVLPQLKTQIKEYQIVKDPETGEERTQLVTVEEIETVFNNKLEFIMAIAHTGNDSNKSKLLRGYGWGSEVNGVIDSANFDSSVKQKIEDETLSESDFDLIQSIWDLTESLLPDVQKAHKQIEGSYVETILAKPFSVTFKDGKTKTYRGGYLPAVIDLDKVTDIKRKDELSRILEDNPNWYKLPSVGKGSTIKRIDEYAAPLSLKFNLIGNHVDWALSYAYIEPTIRELDTLTSTKIFAQLMDKIDPYVYDQVRAWLKRSAIEQTITPFDKDSNFAVLGDFLEFLRVGTVIQFMSFNVGSVLQQFTGLSVLSARLKPKNIAFGLTQYIRGMNVKFWQPNDLTEKVINKSLYMKGVSGEFVQSIQEQYDDLVVNQSRFKTAGDFANKHKYFFIQTAQNVVSISGWWAAYNEAISDLGMTESDAIKYADSIIQTTQGANRAIDISSKENTNKIERFFVQFYSYPNTMYNLLTTESKIAIRKHGFLKASPQLLYLYLTVVGIPGLLTVLIIKGLSAKEPEKEDQEENKELDFLLDFMSNQFQFATTMFPYLGNIISTGAGVFTESKYDDRLNMGPTWSVIERSFGRGVQRVAPKLKDVYTGEKTLDEVIDPQAKYDILTLMGLLTRLPLQPIAKPIKYLEQLEEETIEQPTSDYDYIRGLITGKGEKVQ